MTGPRVTDPSGASWHVRLRWAPRVLGRQTVWQRFSGRVGSALRRARLRDRDLAGPGDLAVGCGLEVLVVVVLGVVLLVLAVLLVVPLLVAVVELAGLVLLVALGVLAKVLFRRPWRIDAAASDGRYGEWSVVGWRRARAAERFVAGRLAAGSVPTQAEVDAAVVAA